MEKFEDYLAPWEKDDDGKKLDEPRAIDAGKLKKFLYGLLSDKEKAVQAKDDVATELDQVKETLVTVQREHETADQAKEREAKEREQRYERLEKENRERSKVDAISAAFEEQGITAARARALAKRVHGEDEKSWVEDAKELVADGFRINDKPQVQTGETDEEESEPLESRPRVVRSGGGQVVEQARGGKTRSVDEEINAAIPISTW